MTNVGRTKRFKALRTRSWPLRSPTAAAAMGRYLLKKPNGAEQIRNMIRDDIHEALSRGDRDHASELLMVLRHFVASHPEVHAKRADGVVE